MACSPDFCNGQSQQEEKPWDTSRQDSVKKVLAQTTEINRPKEIGEYYIATVPDTLDLAWHARLGLYHFTAIISEKDDYEMFWGPQRMGYGVKALAYTGYGGKSMGRHIGESNPPVSNLWWGVLQACQPKAVEAMAMLRLSSGSSQLLDREAKMLEMISSHIKDGLYWVVKDPKKPWLGKDEDRPYATMHGQGRILRAMIAWYQYTGNPRWAKLIDEMVDGLDKIAVHKDDYAYFPAEGWIPYEYFRSSYLKGRGWKGTSEPAHEKAGEEGSLFNHQAHLPGAMATWYTLTGNKKALELSGKLVRFLTKPKFWADWDKGEYPGVVGAEHAHWRGHFHGHVNALRAILDYAVAANDTRLKQFVRDGYEWTRQAEIARIGLVGDGQGCGTGRLIGLAVKLTYAGIGDYWEDIDLYIRNHGIEMQIMPEDIPWLEKRCEGKPAAPPHPSQTDKDVIVNNVGAYSNHVGPYKTSTSLCCSPHGNMGIFYAWDGILRHQQGTVHVNLLLNRVSPWMDVNSYLPFEGKVVLKNKTAKEAFVRMPLWVDLEKVSYKIDGETAENHFFGRYLRIENLKPKQKVTIEFPVDERTEQWTKPMHGKFLIGSIRGGTQFQIRFRGNTVVEISPELMAKSPLYRSRPEKYKATKAQMKTIKQYVSPLVLQW